MPNWLAPVVATVVAGSVAGEALAQSDPFAWAASERPMMVGFPPSADSQVTTANFRDPATTKWLQLNTRNIGFTRQITRSGGAPSPLPRGRQENLEALRFEVKGQGVTDVAAWMNATRGDALLVLRDGKIVYERYRPGLTADDPHAAWSITKSFVGTIAAMLVAEGKLDTAKKVRDYVPELAGSGFGDATVQQLLDMTAGDAFDENTGKNSADVLNMVRSFMPRYAPPDDRAPKSMYEVLTRIGKARPHGETFLYNSADMEAVGWVIQRVAGKDLATLISERLWQPLGAAHDAGILIDGLGMPSASAGMSATLPDLARFGQMMSNGGRFNGRRIVPAAVIAELHRGGDRAAFVKGGADKARPGYSYHDGWWVNHAAGSIEAKGGSGQHIYINPAARTVIVKFSSAVQPATSYTATEDSAAFAAIAAAGRR